MEEPGIYNVLHEKERNLIEFMRELQYGKVTIKVQDGLPQVAEEGIKAVRF